MSVCRTVVWEYGIPLGLRAPVAVSRNLKLAEGVGLGTEFRLYDPISLCNRKYSRTRTIARRLVEKRRFGVERA